MRVRSRTFPFTYVEYRHDKHPEGIITWHLFRSDRQVLRHSGIDQQIVERRLFSSYKERKKKKTTCYSEEEKKKHANLVSNKLI